MSKQPEKRWTEEMNPTRLIFLLALIVVSLTSVPAAGARTRPTLSANKAPAQETEAATPTSKDATVFGFKIHYLEAGSGPTLILLHGLGGNSGNWSFNIGPLSRKYRVIVPDQIGFGRSDKPLIEYRVETYVDFLDKFMSELKISKASLVGNSMGGWVAAAYTIEHPEKVEALVLADSAGFALPKDFDSKLLYSLNPSTRVQTRAILELVFYNKVLFSSEAAVDVALTQRMNAGDGYTISKIVESMIRGEDVLDNRLGKITQPTLIIWGRQDGLLKLSEGERLQREIPKAKLIVFDQCGHAPMAEKAGEFNDAVLSFISGQKN
jgi:2-hydroxy-6-oxonona-2,4-dienedioate hydrolase